MTNVSLHSHIIPTALRRAVAAACSLLALSGTLLGQGDDPLFGAMQDELTRSIDRLKLEGQENPYFVEYRVTETEGYRIVASFGAVVESDPVLNRNMNVSVRVGDYTFDNSGFFSRADIINQFRGMASGDIAIDNEYMALRRDFWLATDKAFKEAVEQMAGKRAYFENRVDDKDTIADFARAAVVSHIDPTMSFDFKEDEWEARARRLSGLMKNYPEIQKSSIYIFSDVERFYLANNEGTRVRTAAPGGQVRLTMSTQASDGRPLGRTITLYADASGVLPSEETIASEIRAMVADLKSLRNAPTLEETYIGPVLMVGEASGALLERTLLQHISGSRLPTLEDNGFASFVGNESELLKRMGRPVMPRSLSVYDDPTVSEAYGASLAGHYMIDAQGVPAERVQIVERGVVKGLLRSRRPGEDSARSNGHARGFAAPGVAVGNLFLVSDEERSYNDLKAELLQACADQGLEFGVIVKRLGPGDGRSMSGGGVSVSFAGGSDETQSTEAFRVYVADGREEPIRGVSVSELNMRTLKDILAAGNDYTVYNGGATPKGAVTFSAVPISVIAPSLLLEEAQVNPPEDSKPKPTLLTNPYFSGSSKAVPLEDRKIGKE